MNRTPCWPTAIFAICIGLGCSEQAPPAADAPRLAIPAAQAATVRDSFAEEGKAWVFPDGKWKRRTVDGTTVLAQTAVDRIYPLALRQDKRYSDVDLSVRFRPLSGNEDASGGLVLRARDERNYLLVRANALENNFRLYTVIDGTRRQIASATVEPPKLGAWHTLRVIAVGPRIQAELDGRLLLDHHAATSTAGYVGLWTKADSVTEFTDLAVTGVLAVDQ